jgi:hypothetical protein
MPTLLSEANRLPLVLRVELLAERADALPVRVAVRLADAGRGAVVDLAGALLGEEELDVVDEAARRWSGGGGSVRSESTVTGCNDGSDKFVLLFNTS